MDPAKLDEGKKLYENEARKVFVIAADSDKTAVKNQVVDHIFASNDDEKARSTKQAAQAAEALARLASGNTRFPVASALEPLLETLQNRPDEVRIPALTALGNLGPAAAPAMARIAGVFSATENDAKVREAAMLALAHILTGAPEAVPDEVMKAIHSGMADADARLRQASFAAYSVSGAPDDDALRQLFVAAQVPAKVAPAAAGAAAGKEKAEGSAEEKPAGADATEEKEGEAKDTDAPAPEDAAPEEK